MTLSTHLAPGITNYQNLALFICHLFIDGHFRTGHILYDPSLFDGRLISDIDLICPRSIPWLMTDVTQPSSLLWDQQEPTDHMLQLIFFNAEMLTKITEYKYYLAFYRLFVFDETSNKNQKTVIAKSEVTLNSNTLIHFVAEHGNSFYIHSILNNDEIIENRISLNQFDTNAISSQNSLNPILNQNIFDETFGKKQQKHSFAVNLIFEIPCDQSKIIFEGNPFIANFYLSNLKRSYANFTATFCNNSSISLIKWKSRKFYKEFSIDVEPIDKGNV